jgi:hypothetical protein
MVDLFNNTETKPQIKKSGKLEFFITQLLQNSIWV